MKKLIKEIDSFYEFIEMGLLTKKETMSKLRELRFRVSDKFDEGSDEFQICINSLIDCSNLMYELN